LYNFLRFPLFYITIFLGLPISFWLLIGSVWSIPINAHIYGVAIGILAYFRPFWAIWLLLFLLPLYGNRPSQPQTHYLIIISSYLLFSLYGKLLLQKGWQLKRFIAHLSNSNITLLFIALWFIVSFISLIGLPIAGAIKHTLKEDMLYIFKEILIVGETTLFSSFQSVFFSLQAMMIGLYVYGARGNIKYILFAILSGLLFSIIAGHLDFFGIYFLNDTLRGTPDTAGLGRLSSFFYNSSWFSQYIVVILPLLPALLLLRFNKRVLLGVMIFLIIIGEITLILSMQRGAWITYPPTLLLIWITIYYTFAKEREPNISLIGFLKKDWLKVVVTIPLTVTLSIYAVYAVKDYRKNNNISVQDTFEATTARAERIAESNDRLLHWPPAIKLWSENPIFGGGGDSFGWQYKVYYFEEDGKYHNDPTHTLKPGQWGTAHNMYLQNLTGRGIFGLVFLLGFIGSLLYLLIRKELDSKVRFENQILGITIIGSLLASVIYANVQEIFYSQSVQIVFWVVVFSGIALTGNIGRKKTIITYTNSLKYIIYLMVLLLPLHILNISFVKEFLGKKIESFMPWFGIGGGADTITTVVWIVFGVALVSAIIHYVIIDHSHKSGFFIDDTTAKRVQQFHKAPTPRVGGIGIFIANLFLMFNPIGWKFLLASLPAFLGGLMDDFASLTPKQRLILQSLSGLLAALLLDAIVLDFNLFEIPYFLALPFFVFAIVGVTNAMNIIDGFNGLSSGVALMVLASFGVISFGFNDMVIFEIVVMNMAGIIGFMTLNFPKGKIFLGDGGAFFIGFTVATISILLVARHEEVSILYPLAILIYPIFEVLFSIYRRKIRAHHSTLADKVHLHQLIYKRVTKSNPLTSVYIWIGVLPFIVPATLFYQNDIALLTTVVIFIAIYIYIYKKIARFRF